MTRDEQTIKQVLEGQAVVHKFFGSALKAVNESERQATFTISTGSVDRDNDTIAPDGWELKNFRKNPVVLWAHMSGMPPIGKAEKTKLKDNALVSTATFAEHELAETVFNLIVGGFLKAASVGFRPLESVWNDKRGGFDFKSQELSEWSVVPVPSNPEAMVEAKSHGIDLEPVVKWAVQALDMLATQATEQKSAQMVWDLLRNPQIAVVAPDEHDVIESALELASCDDSIRKTMLVSLTGYDLDQTPDTDDTIILVGDGDIDKEPDVLELDNPVEPDDTKKVLVNDQDPISLRPSQDDNDVTFDFDADELKQAVRQSVKATMTSLTGKLPD